MNIDAVEKQAELLAMQVEVLAAVAMAQSLTPQKVVQPCKDLVGHVSYFTNKYDELLCDGIGILWHVEGTQVVIIPVKIKDYVDPPIPSYE